MKNKNDFWRRAGVAGLLFASFAGLAAGFRGFLFQILAVDMLSYQIFSDADCFPVFWCLAAGLPALLFLNPAYGDKAGRKAALAALPFILGFVLPRNSFFFFPCFLVMLGWGVFRLVRVFGGPGLRKYPLLTGESGNRLFLWMVLIAYALLSGWGYYMQSQAARVLFICYSDWGTYVESYLRLTTEAASWKDWLSTGSHWNPLVNVLMAGFVRLFPYQEALFLFNSMLIYSAVPLIWIFCRKNGMLPFHAFCFAMAAAFSPVYGNLSLCLLYGFHPIYFTIPLLLLFFLFREKGNRIGMAVCLAATLLVKETMMVFWFGYGVWLLFRRKWLLGGLLAGGCLAGFYVLSSVVLPWLVNANEYPLTFLYSSLGNTPQEVAKSFFTKPEIFWGIALQWQNFAYLAVLLTPCFFCVWLYPGMMIAVLPLLAGICLRGSPEIKSIVLQYGTETTTVLLALSVINFNRIRRGENSLWCRILLYGLPWKGPRILLLNAFAVTVLLVSLLAHYCFAQTLWGKYSFRHIANMPDQTAVIRGIKEKLTPRSRVLASERLRNHFMYEHPTADYSRPRKAGDFLVMALHDYLMDSPEKLESTRRAIAADPKVIPVFSIGSANKHFVVFQVTDGSKISPVPPPSVIPAQDFARIGIPIPCGSPDFETRYFYRSSRHFFLIRLVRVPDYDVDFCFELSGDWGKQMRIIPFGWGLYPAYSCPAGTVFIVEQEAPPAKDVRCFCAERKGSRITR